MTTLREAAQQALEALQLPCPRWNGTQSEIVNAAITALRAALAQEQADPDTCTWHQDGDSDSGVYATSCGHCFSLEDGTPEDNKMQWCCYCGKKLVQELITEDDDE
jgi:hypothetical protein